MLVCTVYRVRGREKREMHLRREVDTGVEECVCKRESCGMAMRWREGYRSTANAIRDFKRESSAIVLPM